MCEEASQELNTEEDFRTKQIKELEQLQKVLDENNALRATFNALQTQVAPQVDTFGPGNAATMTQYQSDRVITSEEAEVMRTKLEQALADYRAETLVASQLNSEIEQMYTELSNLKMKFRREQDEKLTAQNKNSEEALQNFRTKTLRVQENWAIEKERLEKQIGFLKKVYESSSADIKEFEEQTRTNNKGIQHLSSSITIAKEDIREFTEQIQKIEPKLKEYEELQKKHQQSEVLVVELSDQYESLKKQVETESLTANVRKQIDFGNKTIDDLNRQIDKIQCETTAINEKSREIKSRIAEIDAKLAKTLSDTEALKKVSGDLIERKRELQEYLKTCREIFEQRGGENAMLAKEIQDGVSVAKPAWAIRKQILDLKHDVKEMEEIQKRQAAFEAKLSSSVPAPLAVPQRKRVPMIPMTKK